MRFPLLWLLLFLATVAAAPVQPTTPGTLDPSSTTTVRAGGSAEVVYQVQVPADAVMELTIAERQGMAGIVVVSAADGRELVLADLVRRQPASRRLLLPPGSARVKVHPANHATVERVFDLQTGAIVPIGEAERLRLDAEQRLGSGERLYQQKQPGYLLAALDAYTQALALWTRLGEASREREIDALLHIGLIQYEHGDMTPALDTYRRALARAGGDVGAGAAAGAGTVAGSGSDERRPEIAAALYGLSLVSGDMADQKNAEAWGTRSLELRRALDDTRGQVEPLFVLGALRFSAGRNDEARARYSDARTLAQQAGDRVREADAMNFLGVLEASQGHVQEALDLYGGALAIDREEHEPIRMAQRLNNLGSVRQGTGDVRESIALLEEALPIRRALAGPNGYGNTLYNLGIDYAELGDFAKALAAYNEALPLFEQTKYLRGQGFVLRALGDLSHAMGDEAKARQFVQRALALWRAIPDRRGEALALTSLGRLTAAAAAATPAARAQAQSDALTLYRQAVTVAHDGGYKREELEALARIATVERTRGELPASLEHATRALDIARQVSDKIGEADALYQQGATLRLLGTARAADARSALEQSLVLSAASETPLPQANALDELVRLDRDGGHLGDAAARVDKALTLLDAVSANATDRESRIRFAAAHRRTFDLAIEIAMAQGRAADAFTLSERARARGLVELMREARLRLRDDVDPHLLAREEDVQERLNAKHERLTRLLASAHSATREATDRAALDRLVEEYRTIETQIRTTSPRYAALMAPHPISVDDVQHQLLDRDTTLIELWLGEDHSYAWLITQTDVQAFTLPPAATIRPIATKAYHALNARNQTIAQAPVGDSALQPSERSHEVLGVGVVSTPTASARAGAAAPGRKTHAGRAGVGGDPNDRVAPNRRAAGHARAERVRDGSAGAGPAETAEARQRRVRAADVVFERTARELSAMVLGPMRSRLRTRRLWIVSDGELQYIPFAALPRPGGSAPLVMSAEVVGLPSASVLMVVRDEVGRRPRASRGVAVFADPVFRADDERVVGARRASAGSAAASGGGDPDDVRNAAAEAGIGALPRLRFSRQEAEAIAALSRGAQTTRVALDFQANRGAAKDPGLARYRVLHFATHGLLDSRHPELSGIVLSLVDRQGRAQDGFLRLHEIYNLHLAADLVVLSACQTALGEDVRSEGLVGLVRGFMYAGSPQVLASLWSVRDRATAELMRRFYDGLLARHLSPAAALRAAQQAMRRDPTWNAPYYWASFTLLGAP